MPAVAGLFYPHEPAELTATVDAFLAAVPAPRPDERAPKAIVAPHAGYMYSGSIAATAYARIARMRDEIRRVVVLGPAHTVALEGIAAPSADTFRTPLGDIPVVAPLPPGVIVDDDAHRREHCIEVQLPFLQRVLRDFVLLPLVVGHCRAETVAQVLDACWGGPETLIVVSSDLSHYEDHERAALHDRATADAVLRGFADAIGPRDACGVFALRGLLTAAHEHHLRAELLDLRSSGDTAGTHDRVVGYGAFSFAEADR